MTWCHGDLHTTVFTHFQYTLPLYCSYNLLSLNQRQHLITLFGTLTFHHWKGAGEVSIRDMESFLMQVTPAGYFISECNVTKLTSLPYEDEATSRLATTLISRSFFRSSLTLLSYGLKRKSVPLYESFLDVFEMVGFQVPRELYCSKWKLNPGLSSLPAARHFVLILSPHGCTYHNHCKIQERKMALSFHN